MTWPEGNNFLKDQCTEFQLKVYVNYKNKFHRLEYINIQNDMKMM